MCDIEADGSWDFFDTTWRRARRVHKCCACGESVKPGQLYHYTVGKFDGYMWIYKHCARCWRMLCFLESEADEPGSVDLELNCGETFEAPPDHPAHRMAFMTDEEAQRYAERNKRRTQGRYKDRDKLQGRADYYARYGNPVEQKRRREAEHRAWLERNRYWIEGSP